MSVKRLLDCTPSDLAACFCVHGASFPLPFAKNSPCTHKISSASRNNVWLRFPMHWQTHSACRIFSSM